MKRVTHRLLFAKATLGDIEAVFNFSSIKLKQGEHEAVKQVKSFSPPRTDETTTTMLQHTHCTHIPQHICSRGKRVIFVILLRFLRRSVLGLCRLYCIGHSRLWWGSRGGVLGRWGRWRSIVGTKLGLILPHRGCKEEGRNGRGPRKLHTYSAISRTIHARTSTQQQQQQQQQRLNKDSLI